MSCRKVVICVILLTLSLHLFTSCKSKDDEAAPPATSKPVNTSTTQTDLATVNYIEIVYAVYYLPASAEDPVKTVTQQVEKHFPEFKLVAKVPSQPGQLSLYYKVENNVAENFTPPNLQSLGYFGHGLTTEQANALQSSKQALILVFTYPRKDIWNGLRSANALVAKIAQETGGLIWDDETREVFAHEAWVKKRIDTWTEPLPAASGQIIIHAYKKDEYVRAISLGMTKFGQPDIVIDNFSWSTNRNMGILINLFAQAIIEGEAFSLNSDFELDLRAIKNSQVREPQVKSLKKNAKAIGHIHLKPGIWEQGDPHNQLLEISFNRYAGPDLHAQQESFLGEFFGWEDSPASIKHSEELLAASKKAKEQLPALQKLFQKKLAPGEFISVKAPFKVPNDRGVEWMWVEVTTWDGKEMKGLLKNEPYNIPKLHGGQVVTVLQDDIFDYIHTFPDGSTEGNTTGEIIKRQSPNK